VPDAVVIGVDMPLGLVQRGWRQADELAAARLGAHRSRVFRVPLRPVWTAATHREVLGCTVS
jgi:predicted RNase H-like nuclease